MVNGWNRLPAAVRSRERGYYLLTPSRTPTTATIQKQHGRQKPMSLPVHQPIKRATSTSASKSTVFIFMHPTQSKKFETTLPLTFAIQR